MVEPYVIKLKILTESLKKGISDVKNIMHNFSAEIKKESSIQLAEGLSAGHLIAEVSKAEEKIKQFNAEIAKRKQMGLDTSVAEGNVQRLNDFVSAANQRLDELGAKKVDLTGLDTGKQKVKDIGDEAVDTKSKLSGLSISANMTNNTIVNGFEKSWKSIKRFAFSLLSVRGIFGLIRKASSAYMAQDTQMANQMQKTWASLGAMMAPIIEKIVHWIRVAAAYINYFVKALTGKDLIGKAVKKINAYNKAVGGTAKSAKALNKELTTLDEVTNLSFDDTQGIEDASAAFDDFSDIKLDPKVTETLDKWADASKRLWDKLKPVRDILGNIVDWAIDHPDAVLTILGGAALIKTLGTLTGASGIGVFASQLSTLAKIGIVVAGVDLIYEQWTGRHLISDINDIIKGLHEIDDARKNNEKQSQVGVQQTNELVNGYKDLSNQYDKNKDTIDNINDSMIENNQLQLERIDNLKHELNIRPTWNKNVKSYIIQIRNAAKEERLQTNAMYDNWKQGKTSAEGTKKLADAIRDQIKKYKELKENTKNNSEAVDIYNDRIEMLQAQLLDMTGKDYNARVSVDTSTATNKTDTFKGVLDKFKNTAYTAKLNLDNSNAMNKANDTQKKLKDVDRRYTPSMDLQVGTKTAKNNISNFLTKTKDAMVLGGVLNKLKATAFQTLIDKIPAYDVGTPYVPNDQLAMVHKGEAIIPKKFNNQQFFNQGNEETNALLVEVNQNLIELRNRPNVLEVNGKEFAQATYSDYQDEGNRLNQSMTIRRS